MSESYDAAIEIREAIVELTKELKLLRETVQSIVDPLAGDLPGYIRTNFIGKGDRE
jgi:hypothetical protein